MGIDWNELLDLRTIREELGLDQKALADQLGVSLRVVQSCEQGWRNPSAAIERSLLLLRLAHRHGASLDRAKCWETNDCPDQDRASCLVYRCQMGHLCWMLSGNKCQGVAVGNWKDKKAVCGECQFMKQLVAGRLH
ncbi:helix-turn-helix domain-containing protein [Myxococcota bacterium]